MSDRLTRSARQEAHSLETNMAVQGSLNSHLIQAIEALAAEVDSLRRRVMALEAGERISIV